MVLRAGREHSCEITHLQTRGKCVFVTRQPTHTHTPVLPEQQHTQRAEGGDARHVNQAVVMEIEEHQVPQVNQVLQV